MLLRIHYILDLQPAVMFKAAKTLGPNLSFPLFRLMYFLIVNALQKTRTCANKIRRKVEESLDVMPEHFSVTSQPKILAPQIAYTVS